MQQGPRYTAKTPVSVMAFAVGLALHAPLVVAQTPSGAPGQPAEQAGGAPQAAAPAQSQSTPSESSDTPQTMDTMVVQGVRETQRNSAQLKRDTTAIVDAIVNDEVGALPDNSVGETLERIPGVSADRFKGSASEISIRGLGPFLGFSTFNGREVSSGSGDRAVSFQQFPSELTNGVVVYKSQQADLVEGGISGVIDLRSARPLDFKERKIQIDGRANYMPYADKADADIGKRFAGSYIDQFDTGIGKIGVTLGLATTDAAAPEDFYTASSSYRPCNSLNANPGSLTAGNCNYSATTGNPAYFVPNQFSFRQLQTEDKRRGFVGGLQWQPNDRLDLNLDVQLSKRESFEDRHDLVVAEGRRGIQPLDVSADGALLRWAGNSYLETHATQRQRDESYTGVGLSGAFKASDALTLSGDLSYSRTHRNQVDFGTRLRSNTLFGPSGRVAYTADQASSDIPIVNFVNPIDLNNHDAFTGNAFARRAEEDRVDEIKAARFDTTYNRYGVWSQIKAGVRLSDHARVTDLENNNDRDPIAAAQMQAGNRDCRIDNSVSDWGEDSNTNVNSWAQFDARCLYRAFTGTDDVGKLADPRSAGDLNVRERIGAAYVMGSFSTDWGTVPVSGNVGVRLVDTKVRSKGYRGGYTLVTTTDPVTGVPSYRLNPVAGSYEPVVMKHDYQNVLPSFNITAEVKENFLIRGAVYKAIARSNIEDLGAGRVLVTDGTATTAQEALAGASGGNPRLEPLESWNGDLSFEYYPNPDNSFALALFYKQLKAGAISAAENSVLETFVIDGVSYTVPVAQEANSSKSSWLRGFELSSNTAFTWLPSPFDGLGLQLNYSYADTNFEYPDPSEVEPGLPLRDFTDPVSIIGLSKHTGSATAYYEKGPFTLRLAYKYRSGYFKPSGLTAIRTVDDAGFLDMSASYDINPYVQLRLQALNLNNEHQVMYRPVGGSIAESSYFGTSYMLGLRLKF